MGICNGKDAGNDTGNEAKTEGCCPFGSTGDVSNVAKDAFESTVKQLCMVAINGYPHAVRSTFGRRNQLLREKHGNVEEAVNAVMSPPLGKQFTEEAKDFLLVLVPYAGVPAGLIYALWKQLRRGCLIASLFGHDLHDEAVQEHVVLDVAGVKAGTAMGGKALEKATQALWVALVGAKAKLVPLGKVLKAVADVEGKANQAMVEDFKKGAVPIPEEDFQQELDAEPSRQELLQLVKEKGTQTMEQVIAKGKELAKNKNQLKDALVNAGATAIDSGKSLAKGLLGK